MPQDARPAPSGHRLRRQLITLALSACALPWAGTTQAAATTTVEGVKLAQTVKVHGQKLVLNGVGVRQRGTFKSNVTALYLPDRRTTAEAIYKLDGARRVQLHILHPFTSTTLTRIFLSDFKQAATEEEAKRLMLAVSQIGAAYSEVKGVAKGDVFNLDWVPGQGWLTTLNGKPLQSSDGTPLIIKDPLAYQVYLRMYLGPSASEDLRNGLLGLVGLTKSGGG